MLKEGSLNETFNVEVYTGSPKVNPIQGRLFRAPVGRGGGGISKKPVPLLRIYSSKIFLKACPKLSLVKKTWFPWKPWLWF